MKQAEYIKAITDYLTGKDWTSPTTIGHALSNSYHGSPWASPKCLKMVEMGILERNSKGHYRIKK